MSRVYFHELGFPAAELRGSERAHASFVVNAIALGLLHPDSYDNQKKLYEWLPKDHYIRSLVDINGFNSSMPFVQSWTNAFHVSDTNLIFKNGEFINTWELALNTAIAVGNDAIRFFARLHAQCEIHGYIEGPNRNWLADIITLGRACGLYRHDQGWENIITALRARDDRPIVMSYSVCDGFPNSDIANWLPPWPKGKEHQWSSLTEEEQIERERLSESFYDLSKEEQWSRSLEVLRKKPMMDLTPDLWANYRFGHCLTAWDLFDETRV